MRTYIISDIHGKPLTVGEKSYEAVAKDVKKEYGDVLPTYEEYLVRERVEITEEQIFRIMK